ncbi:hypothetical protein [Amycolatopsis sp. WAC 04182]|uniref:hypothetical protein n=1 Tax=Amycolatopsis sp. WAC 04182 TaxID=2203198 RepID=UPI0018F369A5|nr:hypothetical protein [Amycolatopsis sp. WAC 04182]
MNLATSTSGQVRGWFDVVEVERMTDGSSYGSRPEYLPDFMNDLRDDDGRQVMKLDLAENRALTAATLSRFPGWHSTPSASGNSAPCT